MSDLYSLGGWDQVTPTMTSGGGTPSWLTSLLSPNSTGGAGPLAALFGGLAARDPSSIISQYPGQSTPGAGTSGGIYGYIPTGGPQIDQYILQQILGGNAGMPQAQGTTAQFNNAMNFTPQTPFDTASLTALQNYLLGNPGMSNLVNQSEGAAQAAQGAGARAGDISGLLTGNASDILGMLKGAMQGIQSNPYASTAINNAGGIGAQMGGVGQGIVGQGGKLSDLYSQVGGQALNNPFNPQALAGAQQAGGMLQSAGQGGYGQGSSLIGTANAGLPASLQVLNTAFDPQNALYGRTLQQTQDQIGGYLANTGLTNSGVGAKIASDALNNFNIDWQNQQLGRQTQGLGAFTSGVGGAGTNIGQGLGFQQQGAGNVAAGAGLPAATYAGQTGQQLGTLGQLGSGLTTAANLQGTGLGQIEAGNTYGANTFNNLYAPIISALGSLSNATGNVNNMFGQATDQGQAGVNLLGQAGTLPYNAFNTIGNNLLGGLGGYQNLYTGNASTGGNLAALLGNLQGQSVGQGQNYLGGINQASSVAGTNESNMLRAYADLMKALQPQNAASSSMLGGLFQTGLSGLGGLFGL